MLLAVLVFFLLSLVVPLRRFAILWSSYSRDLVQRTSL
jgi:hypothetical protein